MFYQFIIIKIMITCSNNEDIYEQILDINLKMHYDQNEARSKKLLVSTFSNIINANIVITMKKGQIL